MTTSGRGRPISLERDLSVTGLVLDIDRFASHDGPGIRTAVFLKGCPLSCHWCHSPESQSTRPELLVQKARCTSCGACLDFCPREALSLPDPETRILVNRDRCDLCGLCVDACLPGALTIAGRETSAGELVDDIARDAVFYESSGGGVTISGGEPTHQPEFTWQVLAECRRRGIHTAIETTGHVSWESLAAIASVTDLILYDVKLADDTEHRRFTGVSNARVVGNLERLAQTDTGVVVRVPCIPGVNDDVDRITAIANLVRECGHRSIDLLPYNTAAGAKYEWIGRPYSLDERESQSDDAMQRLADACLRLGMEVAIGGQPVERTEERAR